MKKTILTAMTALTALGAASAADLRVDCLSPSNTLVRITDPQEKYLLLPVQENAPMAHIRVLSDGRLDETLNITLAQSNIDFYVPLRLTGRDGKDILLDVRTDNTRSNHRDANDAAWSSGLKLSDTFDTSNTEKYRPAYHHTPLYGWMNDPNGMFYKDGLWHLYYQWNPYGSKWENMSWGHSTSKDLIHWDAQEPVLYGDALGAVFSGSSVVDHDNTAGFGNDAVIALFTSAGASQVQSMAHSEDDGMTFRRYEGNPVIAYERESRDPNMFWDAENHRWVLLLASALDHEMLIFTSPDLKEWSLTSKFGHGYGAQDGVWECPDLMYLPVIGTDDHKWVLICNINPGGPAGGSGTQYFVGDFDGTTFKCDSEASVTKWIDYGKDYYAAVSFSNAPADRKTLLGWMSNWEYANDVPTRQFRSANSLPRELAVFKGTDGEYYVASVPSPEVDALRGKGTALKGGQLSASARKFALPTANDGICEISFEVELKKGATAEVTLYNAQGEKVAMTLDADKDTFSMDRRESGKVDFSQQFPAVTVAPAHNGTGHYSVRLFIDRSSVEAFAADGHFAMTNLVFPENPYTHISFSSPTKGARLEKAVIWNLKL
ncbi:MAG: DUF4980 domain-containing protein [Bacteroides sp.]|nr:DUF4980 domain-containing protein [Bacteroides sp.]